MSEYNHELPEEVIKRVAGFICSEKVSFKDKETGTPTTLYKTLFLSTDKKLLTYWLSFPVDIESSLPPVEIHLVETTKNEKFALSVKDVIVL